jgi:hypothetical protein
VVLLPDPIPDKVAPSVIRVGESGEGGAFAFRDLAPGTYRAVVLDGSDHAHEGDVSYLRLQAARADSIEVRAGQLISVNLKR